MKKNKLKGNTLISNKSGKVRGIGFFEGLWARTTGWIDGSRGLPRVSESGRWISPHLEKEMLLYEKQTYKLWGDLQKEKKEEHVRLNILMEAISYTREQLITSKDELAAEISREDVSNIIRGRGEEKLTEVQLNVRRSNEREKHLAPLKGQVASLQKKLDAQIKELSNLYNNLLEDSNTTRIMCHQTKNQIGQRIQVYWNAVLHRHPERNTMPVVPSMIMTSAAEMAYIEPHKSLMERVERFSQEMATNLEMEVE